MAASRFKLGGILAFFQIVFLVLFGVLATYDDSASASADENNKEPKHGGADADTNQLKHMYPMFQDVHVMIFIGFGFLMTFLKRYGFGAISLNFLIASFVVQWGMLMAGFLHLHHGKILISIEQLLTADFAAAAVLISFGAVLGKASPVQLIIMAFIEIICFTCNEYIGLNIFKAVDMGGSMFVHAFGAYYGLAIARVLYRKDTEDSTKESSVYHSDLFSMIGTVFLWIYWPSFNAALAPGDDQHRAVINTYLALAACCVTTFIVSSALDKHGKLDMVHVQNATLAGGVAVGTSADMMVQPWGAMLIGMVAGTLSTVGYKYITPFMSKKLKIHDTCGVHNLHGMPGVLAGLIGAIVASAATEDAYGTGLYEIFPERSSSNGTAQDDGGRSAGIQAGYQLAALALTLVFALVTGAVTGLILKLGFWDQPKGKNIFDDGPWFETPDDFNEEGPIYNGRKPDDLLGKPEEGDESKM